MDYTRRFLQKDRSIRYYKKDEDDEYIERLQAKIEAACGALELIDMDELELLSLKGVA
jgi:hypothetical protein